MEPRKASEILLSIESKLDQLIAIISANDLTMKIIANKLQNLLDKNDVRVLPVSNPSIQSPIESPIPTVSMFSPSKEELTIEGSEILQEEKIPSGIRRTSRSADIGDRNDLFNNKSLHEESSHQNDSLKIPVVQRIVDKNGKSMFLADVEIINEQSSVVEKVKTNSVGKYQAKLSPGKYKVIIRKMEPISKIKMEGVQDIIVDSDKKIVELPMLIIK